MLGAVREEGGEIVVVGCEKKQDGDGGDESDGGLGAAHARAGEGEVGAGVGFVGGSGRVRFVGG